MATNKECSIVQEAVTPAFVKALARIQPPLTACISPSFCTFKRLQVVKNITLNIQLSIFKSKSGFLSA